MRLGPHVKFGLAASATTSDDRRANVVVRCNFCTLLSLTPRFEPRCSRDGDAIVSRSTSTGIGGESIESRSEDGGGSSC